MKKIFIAVVMVTLCAFAGSVGAVTIDRISGYYSGSGGEFNIEGYLTESQASGLGYVTDTIVNNRYGNKGFETFCLEATEYVNIPGTYTATFSYKAVNGGVGPGGDPISGGTASLYYQFATGGLTGYNYGTGRAGSAGLLQEAIWALEDEGGSYSASNPFMLLVFNEFGSWDLAKANNSTYKVGALNLTSGAGLAQDQLILAPDPPTNTPEPATILLLGLGLLGIGMLRRKQ
jgi:hypothetical protein